jgi:teichuronic acid biosynthesis glycosyltransferase TuaC
MTPSQCEQPSHEPSALSVLWITKREYMHRDLVADRFGRYYEIPKRLSALGVTIKMLVYSYRRHPTRCISVNDRFSILSFGVFGFAAFLWHLVTLARSGRYQTVIGSGDTPYCIIAVLIARLTGLRSVCDIYDNFETYTSRRVPFMIHALGWAVRHADRTIVFEETLGHHLVQAYGAGATCTVPNGIDPEVFHVRNKGACRAALGISAATPVVGYFGSLTTHRGTAVLFDAFNYIASQHPDVLFLMAGSGQRHIPPTRCHVRHLGLVTQRSLAGLICACDAATIVYADNAFAAFSFPQKLMEYVASQVPFVTPAIGGTVRFLDAFPQYLYRVGDPLDLARHILAILETRPRAFPPPITWDTAALRCYDCLIAGIAPVVRQ